MRSQIRNPAVASYLLQHNHDILSSIKVSSDVAEGGTAKRKAYRPPSPVKALTNLFAAVSHKDAAPSKEFERHTPSLSSIPVFAPAAPPVKSTSEPDLGNRPSRTASKITLLGNTDGQSSLLPIHVLEETFSSYVLALHARKGNVVGRNIINRREADEVAISELYNILLEHPTDHERSAQVPVDVLFAAFEKFLKFAWKERLGELISIKTLTDLQAHSETLRPHDFKEQVEKTLDDLAPQNRRALKAIIGLLADLLDGMGNDSDMGTLTAVITDIVVADDDPHRFIPLFDRLVAEYEVSSTHSGSATPMPGSTTPSRDFMADMGSLNTKTASLSKRLGFGSIKRHNSKTESGARVTTLLRQWSRNGRPAEDHTKLAAGRSKPVRADSQSTLLGRSRYDEKSLVFDTFSPPQPQASPAIPTLEQNEVGSPFSSQVFDKPSNTSRKKRRSSLSDLRVTKSMDPLSPFTTPRVADSAPQLPKPIQASPLTPGAMLNATYSPLRACTVHASPTVTKENTPPLHRRYQTLRRRPPNFAAESTPLHFENTPTKLLATSRASPLRLRERRSPSSIPVAVPRAVLTERWNPSNTPPSLALRLEKPQTPHTDSATDKVRIYSPRKLRERLENQQAAIETTKKTLQSDIDIFHSKLSELEPTASGPDLLADDRTMLLANLGTRLRALDNKTTHLITNLQSQTTTLGVDLSRSVEASQRKARDLDKRLKLANEENGALYDRNNEELMRVFNQVKRGQGIEELRTKLKESLDEAAKWRKECARLRSESAG